jgi:hypothetical protein
MFSIFYNLGVKRPKKEKKLPGARLKQEIVQMIELSVNLKHKLVIYYKNEDLAFSF